MVRPREVRDCCLDDTSGAFAPLCHARRTTVHCSRGPRGPADSEAVLGKNLPPKNDHHEVIAKYRYDDVDQERHNHLWRDQRCFFLKDSHLFSNGLIASLMALADQNTLRALKK